MFLVRYAEALLVIWVSWNGKMEGVDLKVILTLLSDPQYIILTLILQRMWFFCLNPDDAL